MKSLKGVGRFMQPYRGVLAMVLFTTILPVAMELVVPRMLQYIIDQGIRASNMAVIIQGSLVMLGAALVGALATVGQGYFRAHLSQGIAFDLRNELFTHIQALSFGNLDQLQTGDHRLAAIPGDAGGAANHGGHYRERDAGGRTALYRGAAGAGPAEYHCPGEPGRGPGGQGLCPGAV
jgi:ATP-binding cassette subfamily B protein